MSGAPPRMKIILVFVVAALAAWPAKAGTTNTICKGETCSHNWTNSMQMRWRS